MDMIYTDSVMYEWHFVKVCFVCLQIKKETVCSKLTPVKPVVYDRLAILVFIVLKLSQE